MLLRLLPHLLEVRDALPALRHPLLRNPVYFCGFVARSLRQSHNRAAPVLLETLVWNELSPGGLVVKVELTQTDFSHQTLDEFYSISLIAG